MENTNAATSESDISKVKKNDTLMQNPMKNEESN